MNSSNVVGETACQSQPWVLPWPPEELQRVKACPICSSEEREIKQQDLVDNVFFVAPGRWTLYQCKRCKSGYLDPRPNEASIGKAYGAYYTHTTADGVRQTYSELGALRRFQRQLANGYLNHRYGTNRLPERQLGATFLKLLPGSRQKLDVAFRYLKKPNSGQKLLDVGCGNGTFLSIAAESGWDVLGVDPDPQAVAAAKQLGFDVRQGSIESFAHISNHFDAITLSHVIEHVHDPKRVIQLACNLLKPDGVIFIDTPNVESKGAILFGKSWRGFEAPRHLVLFSLSGLMATLKESGFGHLEVKRRTIVKTSIYLRSLRMRAGRSPYSHKPVRLPLAIRVKLFFTPRSAKDDEFLTIVARKNNK